MKKNKKLKNILKIKSNYFIITLLIILNIIILIGTSYYFIIKNNWENAKTNNYLFRTFYINTHEEVKEQEIINDLKANKHVLDVYKNTENYYYGTIEEFNKNGKNGHISLTGTTKNTKKIIKGKDINPNSKYEIICPSDFFPDDIYTNNSYDKNKSIDLKNKLNKTINIKFIDKYETEFKLIGLFDRSYDYSNANECYTSHETLRELYNTHLSDEEISVNNIFVLLDNKENIDTILEINGVIDYKSVTELVTAPGDNVLIITGIATIIMMWIVLILTFLILQRRIVKEFKNIGILLVVGYSYKDINKTKYEEAILINIISFTASLILSIIFMGIYKLTFLNKNTELALFPFNVQPISILISLTISLITTFIALHFSLKKIKEKDVLEVIYE